MRYVPVSSAGGTDQVYDVTVDGKEVITATPPPGPGVTTTSPLLASVNTSVMVEAPANPPA